MAFDVSMVGYVLSNRIGAVCYNLVHAYVVPSVLLLSYVLSGSRWVGFLELLWAFQFHIAGDRFPGYGLKFTSSFQDTHLGKIGCGLSRAGCPRRVLLSGARAAGHLPRPGLCGGGGQ